MRKALVVGIDEYPQPLNGAVNDAKAMAEVLSTNGDGSPNFDVKLMISTEKKIDRINLRKGIDALFADESEIALMYFAGHGTLQSTGGYLVATDVKEYNEGVSMDELLSMANKSKSKNKIIFLDCCHSGACGVPAINENAMSQLKEGVSILTASRDSGSALEVNGHGVFTTLAVDAMKGGAADLRGHITPGSIYAYVDQALGAWDQRPIFKTNISSFTSIRTVTPRVPAETLRKLIKYFRNPQEEHALDPSYEDTYKNHDPEKVKIFKDLQKFVSVGLVAPVNAEHMYYAAINSKSCRLTVLGYQYWRLARDRRI